ncbi:hypothetical protein ACTNDZ_13525 [Selenomonas montiformis]|uniref:hypothetical protein n=1 Tax=Selenomonas montiformis TaxID=2652285 RepID=UPI003F8BBCDE
MGIEDRLGKVFSEESLSALDDNLNEMGLPTIPYDITLGEMEQMLAYHGNQLAYLYANLDLVKNKEEELARQAEIVYNEVYSEVNRQSADHKVATLKAIASNNQRYLAAKQAVADMKRIRARVESQINGLQEQNVSLRKIATLRGVAINRGLDA